MYGRGQLYHGMAIYAGKQNAGRGRHGRTWQSPEGNLYYSYFVDVEVASSVVPQLSFVAAIALLRTIEQIAGVSDDFTLKWPNDILLKGKKIAGILLEAIALKNNRAELVIGIGLNLVSHPKETNYPSTDLKSELSIESKPENWVDTLTASLSNEIFTWRKLGFAAIRHCWLQRAFNLSKPIRIMDPAKDHQLDGIFEGIDEQGQLLLRLQNGDLIAINSGMIAA